MLLLLLLLLLVVVVVVAVVVAYCGPVLIQSCSTPQDIPERSRFPRRKSDCTTDSGNFGGVNFHQPLTKRS